MLGTMLTRSVYVLPLFVVCLAVHGTAQAETRYPHMVQAVRELKDARLELSEAAHDFGGHRAAALTAVDAAIGQMEIALTGAGDRFRNIPADTTVTRRFETHSHIHRALHELRATRTELKEARHDFGGHRADALRDVNVAIEQLELALKFARK